MATWRTGSRLGAAPSVTGRRSTRTTSSGVACRSACTEDNSSRDALQFGYNVSLGGGLRHELHAGYQYYVDAEDLVRSSNGWGSISVPGGRLRFYNTPLLYPAAVSRPALRRA